MPPSLGRLTKDCSVQYCVGKPSDEVSSHQRACCKLFTLSVSSNVSKVLLGKLTKNHRHIPSTTNGDLIKILVEVLKYTLAPEEVKPATPHPHRSYWSAKSVSMILRTHMAFLCRLPTPKDLITWSHKAYKYTYCARNYSFSKISRRWMNSAVALLI